MRLIGNDIVDLKTPDAMGKSRDLRFVRRVLTPGEREMLTRRQHPDALLWAFWAAKEAAYKAVSKAVPDVSSAPRRYSVTIDPPEFAGAASGFVKTPHGNMRIRVFFHEDNVHCIASDDYSGDLSDIVYGWEEITTDGSPVSVRESQAVRKVAGVRLAAHLNCNPGDIRILRQTGPSGQGPPVVYLRDKREPVDISLSHDGRFVAYAFRAGL